MQFPKSATTHYLLRSDRITTNNMYNMSFYYMGCVHSMAAHYILWATWTVTKQFWQVTFTRSSIQHKKLASRWPKLCGRFHQSCVFSAGIVYRIYCQSFLLWKFLIQKLASNVWCKKFTRVSSTRLLSMYHLYNIAAKRVSMSRESTVILKHWWCVYVYGHTGTLCQHPTTLLTWPDLTFTLCWLHPPYLPPH